MNKKYNNKKNFNSKEGRSSNSSYRGKSKGKFPKKGNQGTATYEDERLTATNNPDHYMANPLLVDLSGRIPFSNAIGDKLHLLSDNLKNFITLSSPAIKGLRECKAIPGIEVLETVPTFGLSEDASSGINIACQAYYTHIRKVNSGSKNYDAPDIFIYFMAMSSIYSMINWCQRIYGCMKSFNVQNKYLAKALVNAMGVDYDDIAGNLLQFLARLNLNISKIAAFAVPSDMDYFAHVASMYLDIYVDSDSIKDQLYMYNPAGFYKWEFDTSATPVHPEGYLKYYLLTNPGTLLTMNNIFGYLEDMIDRVMYNQDLAVMSGDTLKAYGESGLITLGEIPYDYRTLFKHDESVLLQMKNATVVGYNYNFPDLYQDNGLTYLLFEPKLDKTYTSTPGAVNLVSDFGVDSTVLMSVDGDAPDPKMAFEYSRLMVYGILEQDASNPLHFTAKLVNGADIVFRLHTYRFVFNNDGSPDGIDHQYWGGKYFNVGSNVNTAMLFGTTISPFRYHPFIGCVTPSSSTDLGTIADFWGYQNYTVVPQEQLSEMHRVALYNMLAHKAVDKL